LAENVANEKILLDITGLGCPDWAGAKDEAEVTEQESLELLYYYHSFPKSSRKYPALFRSMQSNKNVKNMF
jgi:hypothetical protein